MRLSHESVSTDGSSISEVICVDRGSLRDAHRNLVDEHEFASLFELFVQQPATRRSGAIRESVPAVLRVQNEIVTSAQTVRRGPLRLAISLALLAFGVVTACGSSNSVGDGSNSTQTTVQLIAMPNYVYAAVGCGCVGGAIKAIHNGGFVYRGETPDTDPSNCWAQILHYHAGDNPFDPTYPPSETYQWRSGVVISQAPTPGVLVRPGSPVTLNVCTNSPPKGVSPPPTTET